MQVTGQDGGQGALWSALASLGHPQPKPATETNHRDGWLRQKCDWLFPTRVLGWKPSLALDCRPRLTE